ncbi:MAG: hypothetical protein QNJ47_01955 [Nostocaceae cyanobacterium]|nr:hypothetical protein [Nostocaceae cyanobacterium]
MSNRTNPENLGLLREGLENEIKITGSTLGENNLQDVYLFELSNSGTLSITTGGFDLIVTLGQDINSNDIFESNEIIKEINLGNAQDEIETSVQKGSYFLELQDDLNGEIGAPIFDRPGFYFTSFLRLNPDVINNPINLGILEDGASQELSGRSESLNSEQFGTNILLEGYRFELPSTGTVIIDKTTVDTNTILARDSNNDGRFDSTDEILAELEDIDQGLGSENESGQINQTLSQGNYFLVFEDGRDLSGSKEVASVYESTITFNATDNPVSNPNNRTPDPLTPVIAGDLSSSDPLYCCNNNNQPFYYDEYSVDLNQLGFQVGDTVKVELDSNDFDPVIMILNADTREVIGAGFNPNNANKAEFVRTIEAGVNYLISVENALPGQTGSYTLTTTEFV